MGLTDFPHGITSFGNVVHGSNAPYMGKVYHVRKTADKYYTEWASNMDHHYWDGSKSVQLSITAAIAVADDFDTVWVYPGTWTEDDVVTITQKGLKLLAATGGLGGKGLISETKWQQYDQGTETLRINAAGVEVAGLRFVADASGTYPCLTAGHGVSAGGFWVHNCQFYDARENYVTLVQLGNGTYNCIDAYVSDCSFHKGKNGILVELASRARIQRCDFKPLNTGAGIRVTHPRPSLDIWDNRFTAQDDDIGQFGIVIESAHASRRYGELSIDGNEFINFEDADHCVDADGQTNAYGGLNNHKATKITIT